MRAPSVFARGLRDMLSGRRSEDAIAASERVAEVLIMWRYQFTGKEE